MKILMLNFIPFTNTPKFTAKHNAYKQASDSFKRKQIATFKITQKHCRTP